MGKMTCCPNRKGTPRIPMEVCVSCVAKPYGICRKRNHKKQLICPMAKEIMEAKNVD